MSVVERALAALQLLSGGDQLRIAARRLAGDATGPLASFTVGDELETTPDRLDGRLLEAIAARALDGASGAVFTAPAEARILAVLGLSIVAARRGVPEAEAVAMLAGHARPQRQLARVLEGVRVLDPCCGGGALLVAALAVGRRCGFEPSLLGRDVAPIAAGATTARLGLLGARAEVACADAFSGSWPCVDLVLSNPPFVRHEALARADKHRAAGASGLSRQADLSAHLAALALRNAEDVALVWPRALDTARSAEPLLADARARGGFAFRVRSRCAGSFAASVDTVLAVWSRGHAGRPPAEASIPLEELSPGDLAALARGTSTRHLVMRRTTTCGARAARGKVRVDEVCDVRFGMKSGCNGFFHLRATGQGRFSSALLGERAFSGGDLQPLLSSLKEASAPEAATPAWHLFRPRRETRTALEYVAAGDALGVSRRPTCAGRSPWWMVSPGRTPAPILYPAKIGARAFAVLNEGGWWEDKKWHALFPRTGIDPWLIALVLGATPIRLAIDEAARQLTGMQAIADVDCRVLAAAPFPDPRGLADALDELGACRRALARDPVTTDVAAMLGRPAQIELDQVVGRALGLGAAEILEARRAMVDRVAARLQHAASVRAAIARIAC